MARPKQTIQRTYEMKVRLSTTEKLIIAHEAKKAGMSMAEYLRERGLQNIIRPRITPEEVAAFRQLAGMANNLNQIARHLNEGNPVVATTLVSALNEVKEVLAKLK